MALAQRIYRRQLAALKVESGPLSDSDKDKALNYLKPDEVDALYRLIAANIATGSIEDLRDDPALQATYALAASYSEGVKDVAPILQEMSNRDDRALQCKLDALLAEYEELPSDARRWFADPVPPVKNILDLPRLISSPDDDEWPFYADPERRAFITIYEDKLAQETS